MKLVALSELIWKYYQDGRPKADKQKLSQVDIRQMARTSAANNFRQQYIFGQKIYPGRRLQAPPEEKEYYFISPLLSVRRFELTATDRQGMRRADMGEFDLYRLPKNVHFENIYMVNGACDGMRTNIITIVQNGEEKFYVGKPDFKSFIFASVVGRGLNTFNVPPCVTSIDVETTFDNDEIDISLDVAFDVCVEVLRSSIEVEEFTGDGKIKLQEELKKREEIK